VTAPALQLWTGQTVHKRFVPFERAFRYDLVLIDIDIDRLSEAEAASPMFRVNRPGVFSFHERDHGGPSRQGSLRAWADGLLARAGVDVQGGFVRLVTFPRHLFYKFAPLSLWYGYSADGALKGIIYEVRNTFGERHCYVAPVDAPRAVHSADKMFHVSPFFDVTGRYRFTLRAPAATLDVVVENFVDGARTHFANIKAKPLPATSGNLLKLAARNPLSTFGVTAAIHWQALQLWIKGARYHSRPALPDEAATLAAAEAPENLPTINETAHAR
jgi:uncharacterized protein